MATLSGELKNRWGSISLRWVDAHKIHLTLKFLGDISEQQSKEISDSLRRVAQPHAPFDFAVGGLGIFPNERKPRVLWVGIRAPDALVSLYRALENELAGLGFPREDRPFSPHLTLGRVSRNAAAHELRAMVELLRREQVGELGVVPVQAVHLYRSELRPAGPVYTRLFSAPLSGIKA